MFADDSYLQTDSKLECKKNHNTTVGSLCKLGFVVRSERSILKPTHEIDALVFVIDLVGIIILVKT